jgi:hypothetical protein
LKAHCGERCSEKVFLTFVLFRYLQRVIHLPNGAKTCTLGTIAPTSNSDSRAIYACFNNKKMARTFLAGPFPLSPRSLRMAAQRVAQSVSDDIQMAIVL